MLISGAEVSRVEDSVRRICLAYGAKKVDVFTITSAIVVTAYSPQFGTVTQTRRITAAQYDLLKLSRLNALSRRICEKLLPFEDVEHELEEIRNIPPQYRFFFLLFCYALISSSFTLFFGGSVFDAIVSAGIGMFLKCMEQASRLLQLPATVAAVLWSFAGGCLALFFVSIGFGDSAEKISIGNIMLLIPGMQLTNSIRDIFNGDTLSAMLGVCNAFVLAGLIAFGFALPLLMWPGGL